MSHFRTCLYEHIFEPKTLYRNVFQSTSTKTTYSYLQKMCDLNDLNFMMILIQIRLQQENCNKFNQVEYLISDPNIHRTSQRFSTPNIHCFCSTPGTSEYDAIPQAKSSFFLNIYSNQSKQNPSPFPFPLFLFLSNKENYMGTPCFSKWNFSPLQKKTRHASELQAIGLIFWIWLQDVLLGLRFQATPSCVEPRSIVEVDRVEGKGVFCWKQVWFPIYIDLTWCPKNWRLLIL